MSTTIKIPMNEETRIALEDCFIDIPNMDARKFIFDTLKHACQDAKRSVRNKATPTNQRNLETGQLAQTEYSLKDVNLSKYALNTNPAWLPKNMTSTDCTPVELKLGENTMKYLDIYGQITLIRHEQFNMAEDKFLDETERKMREANAPAENIERWRKAQDEMRKERLSAVPTCLEEAIHSSIWPIIQQKIEQSDSLIFEKEFQEEYEKPEPSGK